MFGQTLGGGTSQSNPFNFGSSTSGQNTGFGASTGTTTTHPAGFDRSRLSFNPASTQSSTFGGSGFGTATTQSSNFGGFGATTTFQPTFGTYNTSTAGKSTGFSGFGGASTTTSQSGLSGFGTTVTSQSGGFGSFGAPTTSQPNPFGGFGSNTTSQLTGFGTNATSQGGGFGGFGAFGSTTASQPTFGTGVTSQSAGFAGNNWFSSGLGTSKPGAGSLFGGTSSGQIGGLGGGHPNFWGGGGTQLFGGTANRTSSMFGGQGIDQPQQVPQGINENEILVASCTCNVFGDERDLTLAKFHQLQAIWGFGKGLYNRHAPPIEYKPSNPLCIFKSVCYSSLPTVKESDGLVILKFNKKQADVNAGKQNILDALYAALGRRPLLSVRFVDIRPIGDTSEMTFYIEERALNGIRKRYSALEIANHLSQQAVMNQLNTLGIIAVYPKPIITTQQIREILENPPAGINPSVWKQAIENNPDPANLIPVPVIGFEELASRCKAQQEEAKRQYTACENISDELAKLQQNQAVVNAKVNQYRRKHMELCHRVLKIISKQELINKSGFSLTEEEDEFRFRLQTMGADFNAPNQFKNRLYELMSQIRMQNTNPSKQSTLEYDVDEETLQTIKRYLTNQQKAITVLVDTIKEDLHDIDIIEHGWSETSSPRK